MKSVKERPDRKSETAFRFKCPICNKVLPQEIQEGPFLQEPLPCADCFTKFRRRRSSVAKLRLGGMSELVTISETTSKTDEYSENSNQDKKIRCKICSSPTFIYTQSYLSHIKSVHGAFGYDEQQEWYIFGNGTNMQGFDTDVKYNPDYFIYGGYTFLSEGCNKNGLFYGWITICTTKEEAKKYFAIIKIYLPNSKLTNLQWKIPVLSIEEKASDTLNNAYSVRWNHLRPYLLKNHMLQTGKVSKYAWRTKVSISQFED